MRIQKTSQQPAGSGLLPGHLEDINRLSRASLSAQEVSKRRSVWAVP